MPQIIFKSFFQGESHYTIVEGDHRGKTVAVRAYTKEEEAKLESCRAQQYHQERLQSAGIVFFVHNNGDFVPSSIFELLRASYLTEIARLARSWPDVREAFVDDLKRARWVAGKLEIEG